MHFLIMSIFNQLELDNMSLITKSATLLKQIIKAIFLKHYAEYIKSSYGIPEKLDSGRMVLMLGLWRPGRLGSRRLDSWTLDPWILDDWTLGL